MTVVYSLIRLFNSDFIIEKVIKSFLSPVILSIRLALNNNDLVIN